MAEPVWSEISSAALSAQDVLEFRTAVIGKIAAWVGADGGFIQELAPTHAPPSEGCVFEQDLSYIRRCAEGWSEVYAPECVPLFDALARNGNVLVDVQVFDRSARGRLAVYADVHVPQRIRESLLAIIETGPHRQTALELVRRSSRLDPLGDVAVAKVRELRPLLAIAEGYLEKRTRPAARELRVAGLTSRQLQIAELVVRGLTNREIAFALGISPFTVRNQLVAIFEKAQVTTRAELVGRLLADDP